MNELMAPGQTTCAGCGVAIAVRLISKGAPENVIVSCATSCLEVTTSAYPQTAWNVPWIHAAFETASAVASGVEAAVRRLGKPWKVLAIAGDGGTFDIGLQGLSGMLERGHKVTQICVDNNCYANTGVQRSGATPYGAWTTTSPHGKKSFGKKEWKKDIIGIVAAHHIPYVATASVAYPQDMIAKVKKAFEKQPSFIHVHCPCPTGWKYSEDMTVDIGKLAVDTRMVALYEIENGKLVLTKRITDPKPVEEYLKTQGRFRHLQKKEIEYIQRKTDEEYHRLEHIEECGAIF